MYPPHKGHGIGFATLRSYIPNRVLGFATRALGTSLNEVEDGSWTFVLEPIDASTTRLLVRGRVVPGGRPLSAVAFGRFAFEPAHFVMERRMMISLKRLAEGFSRQRTLNHLQSALWTIAFGLGISATVLVFRRRRWIRALLGFGAAAIVFQILMLVQPSVLWGAVLITLVAILLPWRKDSDDWDPIEPLTPAWLIYGR